MDGSSFKYGTTTYIIRSTLGATALRFTTTREELESAEPA